MTKYQIGDCRTEEIWIKKVKNCEEESDGEFTFDTLEECQKHCLEIIDSEIAQLQKTRKEVLKAKK